MTETAAINRRFYDALWQAVWLQRPERFNTWPMVSSLLPFSPARLELGPGLRPRLPIEGTHFIDISGSAIERLNARGGIGTAGCISSLPFADGQFDLVCAFDVIEHIDDDRQIVREVSRVLKDRAVLICAVPLHAHLWTEFDDWVGHVRRYAPAELQALLEANEFTIEKSAAFGMQCSNPHLVRWAMFWVQRHPRWALFWYNWVGMPIAMRFQERLRFASGLMCGSALDEMIVVCRRRPRL
jgi:SAM-dependent methyltransferase